MTDRLTRGEENTLLYFMAEPVLVLSTKGRIAYLNPAFRELFAVERDVVKQRADQVLPEWMAGPVLERLPRETAGADQIFSLADHGRRFQARLRPIVLKGRPAGAVLCLTEETEQVERGRLNLGLLRGMAEDISLPLEEVKSLLARQGPVPEAMKRTMNGQLEVLNENLARLLTYGEILFGQIRAERTPFQPHRLVSLTLRSLRPQAREKNLHLVDGTSRELPMVLGDPSLISRYLGLVTSYMLGVTPADQLVSLSAEITLLRDGTPALIYSTTGVGISGRDLDVSLDEAKIQESFTGLPEAKKGKLLRLILANRLIQAMHGKITVAAHEYAGLTFSARIPTAIHYSGGG